MKHLLQICGTIICLGTSATQAISQTDVAGLQAGATDALLNGNPQQTQLLAQQLLAADPDSYAGWLLLALAQSEFDEHAHAARSAGRAYRLASTNPDRLRAAQLAGFSRLRAEQYARSEIWLRIAANHISTEQEAETVVRGFQQARAANPLSLRLGGWVAPTDNINNGSDNAFFNLEGLDGIDFELTEDRLPLSGVAYSASVDVGYRLSQDDKQRTMLGLALLGETYSLSSDAKELLASSPTEEIRQITGQDFSTFVAQVSLSQRRLDLSPLGPTGFAFNVGRYWRGGNALLGYHDLILDQEIAIGTKSALSIRGSVRDQQALDTSSLDTVIYDLTGSYNIKLANQDQLGLSLTGRDSISGPETSYIEYRTGINYAFAKPILNTSWSTSLELGYRSYEEYALTLDGRRDRFATLQARAVFKDVSYFGFSPSMSVRATRTRSNAEEIESSAVELRLGVESNF